MRSKTERQPRGVTERGFRAFAERRGFTFDARRGHGIVDLWTTISRKRSVLGAAARGAGGAWRGVLSSLDELSCPTSKGSGSLKPKRRRSKSTWRRAIDAHRGTSREEGALIRRVGEVSFTRKPKGQALGGGCLLREPGKGSAARYRRFRCGEWRAVCSDPKQSGSSARPRSSPASVEGVSDFRSRALSARAVRAGLRAGSRVLPALLDADWRGKVRIESHSLTGLRSFPGARAFAVLCQCAKILALTLRQRTVAELALQKSTSCRGVQGGRGEGPSARLCARRIRLLPNICKILTRRIGPAMGGHRSIGHTCKTSSKRGAEASCRGGATSLTIPFQPGQAGRSACTAGPRTYGRRFAVELFSDRVTATTRA